MAISRRDLVARLSIATVQLAHTIHTINRVSDK